MEHAQLMQILEQTDCAARHGGFVFLCDQKWGASEHAQFIKIADAASVYGTRKKTVSKGWLCISTGGTSGKLRFARHDEGTLSAAVKGFCKHYGLRQVNAVDVLPAHHVSGFMARVRCAATSGEHLPWLWKDLEKGVFPKLPRKASGWVLSLVPTQLHRLLAGGEAALVWLHQFAIIFIGGGPTWSALATAAADARLPVVFSYGMTETAAMVAAQTPGEFASGFRSCGRTMPHVSIEIVDTDTGKPLPAGETGLVRIRGKNIFQGYLPEMSAGAGGRVKADFFQTEDLAFWDEQGGLNIVGRRDSVIISGGKKVLPSEVETALRASGIFADVAVVGLPDAEWGQRVVACFPGAAGMRLDMARIEASLQGLAVYKWPKQYTPIPDWSRNMQGKLSRELLMAAASAK